MATEHGPQPCEAVQPGVVKQASYTQLRVLDVWGQWLETLGWGPYMRLESLGASRDWASVHNPGSGGRWQS